MVQINEQQTEFQPSEKIENEQKKLLKIKEKHAKDGGLSKGKFFKTFFRLSTIQILSEKIYRNKRIEKFFS